MKYTILKSPFQIYFHLKNGFGSDLMASNLELSIDNNEIIFEIDLSSNLKTRAFQSNFKSDLVRLENNIEALDHIQINSQNFLKKLDILVKPTLKFPIFYLQLKCSSTFKFIISIEKNEFNVKLFKF